MLLYGYREQLRGEPRPREPAQRQRPALDDHDADYFLERPRVSLKKDPSERYPWGFGVVTTAGMDSQKNHSLGIFRDLGDGGPYFRNTAKYDLVEAYASVLLPLGEGLTV